MISEGELRYHPRVGLQVSGHRFDGIARNPFRKAEGQDDLICEMAVERSA